MAEEEKLDQLKQAVLGNRCGREVEVDPSGQINIPDESDSEDDDAPKRRSKPSKMSQHTFSV